MTKKATVQFWMEFSIDFICVVLANVWSFVIFKFIFNKIPLYEAIEWAKYAETMLLSFILVFIGFHRNIDIHKRSKVKELYSLWQNSTLTYMLFSTFLLIFKNPIIESRYLFVSGYTLLIVFSAVGRYFSKRWLTCHFTKSKVASLAAVITTKDIAYDFIEGIKDDWTLRITGIALLDNLCEKNVFKYTAQDGEQDCSCDKIDYDDFPESICDIPVISTDSNFLDWIRCAPFDEVFINLPYEKSVDIQSLVEELESMGITVHINIPTLGKILDSSKYNNISCKMYSGYPMATFAATVQNKTLLICKRVIDIILGLIGSIGSLPIILITAIPLLIESPGPLIFKQQRVGKNGRIFNIYKLRSMYTDAEERKAELMSQNKMEGFMFKMDNDPRITKVGRFIRKYSIDELPQFWNVVKGDMSIIGTRPPTVDEFEKYESHHKRRLSMRPGITGMWQVSGRSDIQDFEEVVRLDCQYIDEWSAKLDTKIFFKTIKVVLNHEGAE